MSLPDVVVEGNVKESLLNLIRFGDIWAKTSGEAGLDINLLTEEEGYIAVPGCMAAVKIKVNIDPVADTVSINGLADSRVALGMLAVVSQVEFLLFSPLCVPDQLHSLAPTRHGKNQRFSS